MRGERFQHDLLLEGVLNAIGSSVQRFLHRRCAEFLEDSGDPARGRHALARGWRRARAIPWWLRATDDAQRRYRLQEASEFAERAGYALERLGNTDDAFDALERAVNHRVAFDLTNHLETLTDALFRLARTDTRRTRAWLARTRVLNAWQFAAKAENAARQGLKLEPRLEPMTNADLHAGLAEALWRQERHAEAITAMRPALETYAALGDTTRLAQTEGRLGIIHGDSEDHRAARDHLKRSVALLEELGDDFGAAKSRNMLGITLGRIGLVRDALEQHQLVRVFCERVQGAQVLNRMNLANMGQRLFDLDRYEEALEVTRWAVATLEPEMGWARAYSQTHQVRIKLRLGATQDLGDELRHILGVPGLRDDMRFDALLLEAMLHVHLGRAEQARAIFDELRAQLRPDTRPFKRIELHLAAAPLEPPEEALELTRSALKLTQRFQLNGLHIAALTRTAQIHASLGDLECAFQHTSQACELLEPSIAPISTAPRSGGRTLNCCAPRVTRRPPIPASPRELGAREGKRRRAASP
ncbi:MAG: tetratricopeptide repeat protein [Pleurocapsa sp. SU_196_0]|nr:tetratricopeptide repeat protein [Pleurocapsa sp. SU_196_0]